MADYQQGAPGPDEPGPDDTAAFRRFYSADDARRPRGRGLLYRLFIGWWRDRA